MNPDTKALLLECGAGAQMALCAIDDVLGQTREKKLEQALLACRQTHRTLLKQTKALLDAESIPEKRASAMARGMSWLKTNTKLAISADDETVADLIVDGCNMGVKALMRCRNRCPDASEQARRIAAQIISSEQLLCRSMQPYL